MSDKIKVGIVGCGVISDIYLNNLKNVFNNVEVIACCDLIRERAEKRASEYGIPKVYDPEDFYKDDDIELVVNLTYPKSHTEVDLLALNAGKHIYSEKPYGLEKSYAKKVIDLAKSKNLLSGSAPETFMGGGLQTCRKLIDDGAIGEPIAATGFMMGHGPESWHPDPEFFYEKGGGPMFDMGPYYLTALVSMLGPVKTVSGAAKITFPQRTITSQPKYGKVMNVEIPTYLNGTLTFANGVIGTVIVTFDVWGSTLPNIEIYGTEGTLRVPDPNTFGGPVKIKRANSNEWEEIPLMYGYQSNSRGIGVSDMCSCLINGGTHRAHSDMAFHVLDIMESIHVSSDTHSMINLDTTCQRPAPMESV